MSGKHERGGRVAMATSLAVAVRSAVGVGVSAVLPLGGGCISQAASVELADGRTVFAKGAFAPDGATPLPPDQLAVEAEGLTWLGVVPGVAVPEVVALTDDVLVLEWVEPGRRVADTDERLGRGLAALHRAGADGFGWHRDGFIGSWPQRNTPPADDWPSFWLTRRIEPLARAAVDRRAIDGRAVGLVGRLGDRIAGLAGPPEPPARVHGDLWSGNVHVDRAGKPWLIDPAAYGGHREVDLAMLHLFGAPAPAFAAAYDEVHPLAPGWRDRLHLWQLEPLLVHTVLFGGGYGDVALAVLERFT